MTTQYSLLLTALQASLKHQALIWPEPLSEADCTALFQLAQTQKVLPLVYEALRTCPQADAAALTRYRPAVRQQVMAQVQKTTEFGRLYAHLTAAGVTPLVVKGLICRTLYPDPDARLSADEDILIPPSEFPAAHEAMLDYGMALMEPGQDIFGAYEVPYHRPGSPIHIELHKSLFPPDADAYGDFNRFFAEIHRRALPISIDGTEYRMPCHTDHLLYLLLHAFKHLIHSGFGIRQVSDICLFARRYECEIDWDFLRSSCASVRAERFAAAVFRIGETHLGIPAPSGWPEIDELPLLEDLLSGGIYGSVDRARQHSSTITLNAVSASRQGKKASVWRSAFPPVKALKGRYPYLEKHPALLPLAWADRLWKYRKETAQTGAGAAESIEIGQKRLALLRQYGILP